MIKHTLATSFTLKVMNLDTDDSYTLYFDTQAELDAAVQAVRELASIINTTLRISISSTQDYDL
ncbi:hypothetical protein BN109_003 [Yersinia phage phi80-18]|uniref:Uncharacterized protein n=1 Tax=Yersinia phage phi80-18 TaxID=1206559 RepID=I7LHC0_9CAUD|nr:hypothetical protein BN109_003 [Yersinia phage phi80-18]CCI88839.1 hypothetical protein BN109_003 [Yersinia phage phi80-18]